MIGENANNAFVSFIQNTQFSLVLCKSTFSCCVQEPFLSKNLRCWLPWLFVGKRESVFLVSFLSVCAIRRSTDNGINNTGNDYIELNSGIAEAASHFSLPLNISQYVLPLGSGPGCHPDLRANPPPQQLCNQVLIKDVHSLLVCVLKCFRLKKKTKRKKLCFPLDVTQMWLLFVRFVFTVPCAIVMSWKCSIPL